MPTNWQTYPVKFEGGWITTLGRLEQGIQAPGSATALQNYEVSIDGGYKRIEGYTKFSNSVVTGTGQVVGVIVVDTSKAIAYRTGKYYTSTGGAWTLKATAANTAAIRIKHTHFNFDGVEKIVIVDRLNDPAYYNTVTDTITFDTNAPADVTGATNVCVFKNHVFFAKNNLLTFTAPYDELDYAPGNGAGTINVGSDITGLIVFREQLIVFGIDRIQRIVGDTSENFALQPIADNTGCLCQHTVQEVGGDIMYMGPDGIRFLSATERNNDFGLQRASEKIQDVITEAINSNCGYSSFVIASKSQYRLLTFISGTPRTSSSGFIATNFSDQSDERIAWSKTIGIKAYDADHRQFRDREIILFCSDTDYVYRMESGNSFDGANIETIFETPYMPITDPRFRKTIYKHSLYASVNGTFSVGINVLYDYSVSGVLQPAVFLVSSDGGGGAVFGSSGAIFGTSVFSQPTEELYLSTTLGSGFTVALRYRESSTNPTFNLDYAVLEYRQNERR